ncbi:hypothetical protein Adt_09237 [Abeliophyllum distichum]|uniref:Uncharacterized protein n=1 Tax=Abeliophyllum distichum TaxID=126358 RepID=A0ABD1UHH0_9LAMI
MGCCVSTASKSAAPNSYASKSNGDSKLSKSPPPSLEEETVKEVLSETPTIPKQTSSTISTFQENHQNNAPSIKPSPLLTDFSKILCEKQQIDGVFKKPVMVFNNDDVSEEFSEICSTLSESVSVSTSVTEKRENNENVNEVRQSAPARFKNRSFSGEVKKEKTVEKTPGRRSDPSPGRARSGPVTGRNGPAVHGRRDSGEGSCRRSMSPVTRTHGGPAKTGMNRNQLARRTGKSPGRVGSGLSERTRKMEEGNEIIDSSSSESKWPATSTESLENPLVSLECFIFL